MIDHDAEQLFWDTLETKGIDKNAATTDAAMKRLRPGEYYGYWYRTGRYSTQGRALLGLSELLLNKDPSRS